MCESRNVFAETLAILTTNNKDFTGIAFIALLSNSTTTVSGCERWFFKKIHIFPPSDRSSIIGTKFESFNVVYVIFLICVVIKEGDSTKNVEPFLVQANWWVIVPIRIQIR